MACPKGLMVTLLILFYPPVYIHMSCKNDAGFKYEFMFVLIAQKLTLFIRISFSTIVMKITDNSNDNASYIFD